MNRKTNLVGGFFVMLCITSSAQTAIYLEDFSGLTNGTAIDAGTTAWTTDLSVCNLDANDVWSVQNGEFEGRDTDCDARWLSQVIDISGHALVDFSITLRGTGSLDMNGGYQDYVKVFYKLDGSPEQLWFEDYGHINQPVVSTCGGFAGSTVQLIVQARNTGDDEHYYFDNVTVSASSASTIPTGPNTLFAIASGNWNNGNTWSVSSGGVACGCIPNNNSEVHIECGYTVNMNVDGQTKDIDIYGGGQLKWTSHNTELHLRNGGAVHIHPGGSMHQNGRHHAELEIEDGGAYVLHVDGSLNLDEIDINHSCDLLIEGVGSIYLSDDFDVLHTANLVNKVTGSFIIHDDLRIAANYTHFENHGVLRVNSDLWLNHADDGLLENLESGELYFNDDIEGNENTDRFVIRNEGKITLRDDLKESPTGNNACHFYNLDSAIFLIGHNHHELDWRLHADYPGNVVNYYRNGWQNRMFVPEDAYWHLTVSGSGGKKTRGDLTINGDLLITGHAFLNVQDHHDDLVIRGDWISNSTHNNPFREGSETVTLNGMQDQLISTGSGEVFHDLVVASGGNVLLDGHVVIENNGALTLSTGVVFSSNSDMLYLENNATSTEGNPASFVHGPMQKRGNDGFVFPVGKNGRWARIAITPPAHTNAIFQAEYFDSDAHSAGYDTSLHTPTIHNLSAKEYWLLDRVSGNDPVMVTLYWEDAGGWSHIDNMPDLKVARFSDITGQWEDHGNGGTSGSVGLGASGKIKTDGLVSNFSPFTFASGSPFNNSLPVELLSFDAIQNGEQVDLAWITGSEFNNDKYLVQRSADGQLFDNITEVTGMGNTTETTHYDAVDTDPLPGLSYYRLKQVDFDGAFAYSELVAVQYTVVPSGGLAIWPNPVVSSTMNVSLPDLESNQSVNLELRSSTGESLYFYSGNAGKEGIFKASIDIAEEVPSGMYVLISSADNRQQARRVIVRQP